MDIDKHNRAELRSYFVRNAIPTESNFADLIDGMLNQKDDGIVKPPSDPLSIEAAGDATSQKKIINFYRSFSDANPDWTISLNPRGEDGEGNAPTAKVGFNISDGEGHSRLFIDRNTGNVGIGTTSPGAKLEVVGDIHAGNSDIYFTKTDHTHTEKGNTTGYAAIENAKDYDALMILGRAGTSKGRYVRLWDYLQVNGGLDVTGNVGIGTTTIHNPQGWNKVLDILGTSHARLNVRSSGGVVTGVFSHDNWAGARGVIGTESNHPLTFITNYTPRMTIDTAGNVGIGTLETEGFKLHVAGSVKLGGFTGNDADEWPNVVWCRDFASAWDEGLIKHASGRGVFSRAGFGVHMHENREFGFWSSNWTSLFAVKGGSGDGYFRGNVGIGTTAIHNPQGWRRVVDILGPANARLNVRSSGGVVTSIFGTDDWGGPRGAIGTDSNHPLTFITNYRHRMTIDTAGNVSITGNLGTHGYSPTPRTSGWGGGIHTWDIEAEGTVWSRQAVQTGARDVAENYFSDEALEPGDVVRLDDTSERIVRSEKPNDTLVVGVISSAPGVLLNVDHDEDHANLFPVALCGCVPCKVVDENGPIQRGDLLTSSSIPGCAMKAQPLKIGDEELFRPGTIIGKALGALTEGTGVIEIFVTGQ